jgi:hypothetical protein
MKSPYSRTQLLAIAISLLLAIAAAFAIFGSASQWVVWLFAGCAVVLLVSPLLRKHSNEAAETVEFDEKAIRRKLTTGEIESIAWDELAEIAILTTNQGPYLEDAFWLLSNVDGSKGCAIPNGAEGFKALLKRFQRLPNFDNAAASDAMETTSNRRVVVWKRDHAKSAAAGAAHPPGQR